MTDRKACRCRGRNAWGVGVGVWARFGLAAALAGSLAVLPACNRNKRKTPAPRQAEQIVVRDVPSALRGTIGAEAALQRSSITNVSLFVADGSEGYREGAPYDRIVIHSAFPAVPRLFVDQLVAQGALICAIGPGDGEQMLVRMQKVGSRFERQDLWPVRYQPIAFGTAEVL